MWLPRDWRVKTIPPDTYPVVYAEPYTDYTASGPDSGSYEQLTLGGGKNIAEDIATSLAEINTKWVIVL
ncbi:MAG: hypothetical protein WCF90_09980 [Methanomicrobiales archaeon]